MEARNLFVGDDGHLRSGWRATFFTAAFLVCWELLEVFGWIITSLNMGHDLAIPDRSNRTPQLRDASRVGLRRSL
jgi:hypothetical protein